MKHMKQKCVADQNLKEIKSDEISGRTTAERMSNFSFSKRSASCSHKASRKNDPLRFLKKTKTIRKTLNRESNFVIEQRLIFSVGICGDDGQGLHPMSQIGVCHLDRETRRHDSKKLLSIKERKVRSTMKYHAN